MKCVVPGPNVKVLGRAIHSLAKLGDDLYLEFTSSELTFRTANSSKTAYATFQFSIHFFSFFSCETDDNSKNSVKCQISMKSSLSVFRSPVTLDRIVDSLHIQLCSNSDKLIFLLKYKKGYVKTYYIPVIECETLQVYYHKENTPNKVIVQPKVIGDILSNFQSNDHEITWKVYKDKLIIRNYSDNDTSHTGVRTEITVQKGEFDEFKIEKETDITFCLKELKAVLLFSDHVALPLIVCFLSASKPIVFLVKGDAFEADIVVSTFTVPDADSELKKSSTEHNENGAKNVDHEDFSENQNYEFLCDMQLEEEEVFVALPNIQAKNTKQDSSMINKKSKLKQVFQRCFDKERFDVKKLPGYNVVLASDSDSDSEENNT